MHDTLVAELVFLTLVLTFHSMGNPGVQPPGSTLEPLGSTLELPGSTLELLSSWLELLGGKVKMTSIRPQDWGEISQKYRENWNWRVEIKKN